MNCYLTYYSKKHCNYNDKFFDDIFKHKDHKKREKNKPRLSRTEIALLMSDEY